jgi:cytidyltransferase-like protein
MSRRKQVMVSGAFDPLHIGHIRLIEAASAHGDVIVALNSDEWIRKRRGYFFMDWKERRELVLNIKGVKKVVSFDDSKGTACDAIEGYSPDIFANGGDRYKENTPEVITCNKLGVEMIWFVGGGKVQSSSELLERVFLHEDRLRR